MRSIVCCALVVALFAAAVISFGPDEVAYRLHINTTAAHAKPLAETLKRAGIDANTLDDGRVIEIFASANDLKYLAMNKYQYTVVEKATPLQEKVGEQVLPSGYHDLAAINNILFAAQSKYPNIAKVVDVGREYGIGNTYEGRPMYALKISDNVQVDEDEPNLLFVSLHHSREIVTPEIILEFIRRLTEGYATDNIIKSYVDANEIFLAPVWNPDGLEYVWRTNNLWRKNRKLVSSTAYGVDQNRNYDLGWASSCGGSSIPSSETYRGPSANSEEETQNLILFGRKRNFAKVVDFHSYGREVLVSYTCTPIPKSIADYNIAEGIALGKLIGYGYRVPSADGEHQQLAIKEWTTYSFLVETETEFQPRLAQPSSDVDIRSLMCSS
eukprot:TRINITY_DN953_c0_g1_i1.p1 TRINITY_DN953_c0_g1~~TRINITY_DN953_c0_g1_i1.p1  ORF type:complete len:384 (-),score=81.72 TRINITY_DN953_c0_g1_i1:130-1281(-)